MCTAAVLSLVWALAACGSSSGPNGDLAAAYAGLWTGTLTSTVGTTSNTRTGAKLAIEEVRSSSCAGTAARRTSTGKDRRRPSPAAAHRRSADLHLRQRDLPLGDADIRSGNGSLTGSLQSTLTVALTAVVTDCAGTGTDLLTYSATTKAAYGSAAIGAPPLER